MGQGILRKLDTIGCCDVYPTHQDDECRTGTYHQGIRKHAQCLDESLFHRMAHRGHRSRIRSTTLACLIAEQASLDALYHRYAKYSARSLIESEGILHNGEQYLRQAGDVPDYYAHGYQEIDDCHHWNYRGRKLSHSLDTAEDDEQREQREHDAHGGRIDAEGLLPCQTDGVALHGIIGKTEGDDHQHGKEDTHPSLAQSILHIIGWSAIEGSLALTLVKLGKRGFYEG